MNFVLISVYLSLLGGNSITSQETKAISACPEHLQPALLAIIAVESDYRPNARSSTGDIGLAQVNPRFWAHEANQTLNLALPEVNISRACHILGQLYDNYATKTGLEGGEWASYYHSKTKKHRQTYWRKVKSKLELLKYGEGKQCR